MKPTAVVFVGASNFLSPELTSRPAFSNSKDSLARYFEDQDVYHFKSKLDLFDSKMSAAQQVEEIDRFIASVEPDGIEFFFLVYVGHGMLRTAKDDYFWAVASTNQTQPFNSSIDVRTLGHSIKKLRASTKCVCIVDSCFSAATAGAFMANDALKHEVKQRTEGAFPAGNGCLVVSSSGIDKVSYISSKEEITLFTRAAINVLRNKDNGSNLTPTELVELCELWMQAEEPTVATSPQLISPHQRGASLLGAKLFPVVSLTTVGHSTASIEDTAQKEASDIAFYPSPSEMESIRAIVPLARALERELVQAIDRSSIKERLYAYYARTKNSEAIARKIQRKRKRKSRDNDLTPYDVASVTDVVGLRLITLFRDDIGPVLHDLCKLLVGATRAEVTRLNPFEGEPVMYEAIAYYSDTFPSARSYAMEAKEILSSYFGGPPHNITVKVDKRDEYSSVHIVFKSDARADTGSPKVTTIPVELQVRSVFEDAWAQIDHKLRYTRTRVSVGEGGDDSYISERENIPPFAEHSLKLLKRFLDNSCDLAEIIRNEAAKVASEFSKPTPALDALADFVSVIRILGGLPEEFDQFCTILSEKDDLDRAYRELGPVETSEAGRLETVRKSYGKLAEDINRVFEAAESRREFSELGSAPEIVRFYFYSLRMEEAFCRMFSASPSDLSEIREARAIYSQLLADFDDFPPLHFRISQAHKSLGDIDAAIASLRHCSSLLNNAKYSAGSFDHRLSEKQYLGIFDSVDRLLGVYIWTRAQHTRKAAVGPLSSALRSQVLAELDEAIAITLVGLSKCGPSSRRRNLNNVVAFLNDCAELEGAMDFDRFLKSMKGHSYEEFFSELAGLTDVSVDENIRTLETLATGFRLLDKLDEASRVSLRIVNIINGKKLIERREMPAEDIQEILGIALKILHIS